LWYSICTDPVLGCVNNPEGLNYGDLLEAVIPELGELANGMRLNTEVPSQDLSYPVLMPKLSTHYMHDPGSIIPQIRAKVLTDNQMSRI
jgi:hypothetical protein